MTNPLDPGPEVRAVWTADTDERRAMAHYEGHYQGDFAKWGEHVYAMLDIERCANGGTRWLEWGCGGGAVARAVSRVERVSVYHAVDISVDALQACWSTLVGASWLATHRPHQVAHEETGVPANSVDYVISSACFQHFPSFDYARAVLAEMRRVAAFDARGLIQTRYFVPGDNFDPAGIQKLPYARAYGRYCTWQVPEFWAELERAGFAVTDVVLEPERQYAWYRFGVRA